MKSMFRALCWLGLALMLIPLTVVGEPNASATQQEAAQPEATAGAGDGNVLVRKGVRIEFSIEGTGPEGAGESEIREGEYAEVSFRITDEATGTPLSPLEPAVWVSRAGELQDLSCREQIGRYLQGLLSFQADVDLNKFFLLILNNDRSISVVDPLLGVSGITQLYSMIMLKDPGEDWVRGPGGQRLFITMPDAGEVAVVELDDFRVIATPAAGHRPMRIALQPDGRYLWVGNDGAAGEATGVTVLDAATLKVAASIPLAPGHQEIAFSDDSLYAFVTSDAGRTLSVIDVQKLEKVRELATESRPVGIAYSSLRRAAYLATEDGTVAAVAGDDWQIASRLATGQGLAAFRLDPSGRWGFVANRAADRVDIFDASSGAIAHRLDVGDQPHQFAFTDTYAYVRHLGTADVTLIPLSQLSLKATPGVQVVSFGSKAPGEYADPSVADAISPTGEWTSVVTANPMDRMVYYYMEGMIAPMGSYPTYGRIPRAVGVVDRSVRETDKGVYSAKFKVPESGQYEVAFLIDSPVVDHCFTFDAEPNEQMAKRHTRNPISIEYLNESRNVPAGEPLTLRFALRGTATDKPLSGLEDVVVFATRPPGVWQDRQRAKPLEDGRYEVRLLPDAPGAYYVSVGIPSLGIDFAELPFLTFQAEEAAVEEEGAERPQAARGEQHAGTAESSR